MCKGVSDMLGVALLLKEVGLGQSLPAAAQSTSCRCFETIEDLQASAAIMDPDAVDAPTNRKLVDSRGSVQEVMLGYSDSNKGTAAYRHFGLGNSYKAEIGPGRSVSSATGGAVAAVYHGRGRARSAAAGGPSYDAIIAQPG